MYLSSLLLSTQLGSNDNIGLRQEYASKLVRDPSSHILDYKTVQLQHILGGPFVEISCYEFKPSSPPDPNETHIFWKEKWGWNESLTTCWSSKSLKHDLEHYVEQNVDIFVEEACKRSKYLAPIFKIALKLIHVSDSSKAQNTPLTQLRTRLYGVF
jgi:hypothetical protein